MKNKGFTLIELLGSITLLAAIALIAFPAILSLLNNSQTEIDKAKKEYIESAAAEYVNDNINDYEKIKDSTKSIPVSILISEGYISESMIEPKDGWCVKVSVVEATNENGTKNLKYTYKFKTDC
ncbi:MAG: type II secretion system protein [Bacilli bacterium]|nr:type II secretion system protein [Bacilli bacterium]